MTTIFFLDNIAETWSITTNSQLDEVKRYKETTPLPETKAISHKYCITTVFVQSLKLLLNTH